MTEWNQLLRDQVEWHWQHQARPRLAGLSDEEYLWEPVDYASFRYAGTAATALEQLDEEVACWLSGVRALGEAGLEEPCGPSEGQFADAPLAALVLHINRELIHHLAEVSLLRDLYRHRTTGWHPRS